MNQNEQQSDHSDHLSIEIRGNIGPAAAIGKGNRIIAQNVAGGNIDRGSQTENPERTDFLGLIRELQTKINRLERAFTRDDAKELETRLASVTRLSTRDKPPVQRIKRDLETVREIIEETAVTAPATATAVPSGGSVAPLLPLVERAWEKCLHWSEQ